MFYHNNNHNHNDNNNNCNIAFREVFEDSCGFDQPNIFNAKRNKVTNVSNRDPGKRRKWECRK